MSIPAIVAITIALWLAGKAIAFGLAYAILWAWNKRGLTT